MLNKAQIMAQIAELQAQLKTLELDEVNIFETLFEGEKTANFIMKSEHPLFNELSNVLVERQTKKATKYIEAVEAGELVVYCEAKVKLGKCNVFMKGTKWCKDNVFEYDVAQLEGITRIKYDIKEYVAPNAKKAIAESEKVEIEFGTNIMDIALPPQVETKNELPEPPESNDVNEWNDYLKEAGLNSPDNISDETNGKYESIADAFADLESDLGPAQK